MVHIEKLKRNNNIKRNKGTFAIVAVAMTIVLIYFSIFLIFPIIYAFVGSFFDWNPMINIFKFTGFSNYKEVLSDSLFWSSLGRTIYFTAIVVTLRTILALIIAVLISNSKKFKTFFRTTYFLPVITSIVAVSLLWKYFYDPTIGLFNSILNIFGLPQLAWLKSTVLVLPSIMLMVLWKDVGYSVVIYLAGISGISPSFYEAGLIDGANKFQLFKYVTIPLLKPTTLFVIVTSLISYLQIFTPIMIMTAGGGSTSALGGGPGRSAYTIVFLLYNKAFVNYEFGTASAISMLLFVIILLVTLVQIKVMKTDWR